MRQQNLNNILVPVYCHTEINLVLRQANYFHEIYNSTITFLIVLPKMSFISKLFSPSQNMHSLQKDETIKKLNQTISDFYNGHRTDFIETKITEGRFVNEIKNELKRKKYDLLLLKEFSEVRSLLDKLQKMSEKVISRIDCPVMILHEKWTQTGINEILIPIDITRKCKDTLMWAVQHSRFLGANISFVAIVDTPIDIPQSLTYQRSQLIKKWIEKQGLDCSISILKSSPGKMADKLLEYAENGKFDLIMILTHKEYIASHNHLGKFAKQLIHDSPKPVMSMSLNNKPLFKLIGRYSKFSRKHTERLNLKEWEQQNLWI